MLVLRPRGRSAVRGWNTFVVVGAVLALTACSGDSNAPAISEDIVTSTGSSTGSIAGSSTSPTTSPASPAAASLAVAGLSRADVAAGLLSRTVVRRGTGRLRLVKGKVTAPAPAGAAEVTRVRVEVEGGLKVDGQVFADFVLDTLNDDRSWSHDSARSFARTDGRYDVRVVLASPDTSARLCRPLVTYGKLSCGTGRTAILTMYRWVKAIPEYRKSPTGYRRYVVNHEVGHTLGYHHEYCAGKGKVAPVMMQQTKGLLGCRPNPWPFP